METIGEAPVTEGHHHQKFRGLIHQRDGAGALGIANEVVKRIFEPEPSDGDKIGVANVLEQTNGAELLDALAFFQVDDLQRDFGTAGGFAVPDPAESALAYVADDQVARKRFIPNSIGFHASLNRKDRARNGQSLLWLT